MFDQTNHISTIAHKPKGMRECLKGDNNKKKSLNFYQELYMSGERGRDDLGKQIRMKSLSLREDYQYI